MVAFNFLLILSLFLALFGFCMSDNAAGTCKARFLTAPKTNDSQLCTGSCSTVRRSDPRYDDLRRHSNKLDLVSDAAYIIYPKNTEEVASALRYAMENGLRPTVRSGGHCYEDFWTNNTDGVLIDVSSMNKIYRQSGDPTIWVEAGVKLDQLYTTLYKDYGVTAPAGSCLTLGVGGHVAGGGHGWLARKYGLIIDYVESIELVHVTANKSVRVVLVGKNSTRPEESNLFWGLLGGGGQNFGVITKFGFRNLPPSPPLVHSYQVSWNLNETIKEKQFLDFLDKYVKFFVNNSDVDSKYCDLDTSLYISCGNGKASASLSAMVLDGKQHLVDEFFDAMGSELMKTATCEAVSYFRFATVVSSGLTDGNYYTSGSAYMVGPMPSHQSQAIWHYMTDPAFVDVVGGSIQIRNYGCAVSRIAENGTAYPHRKALIKIQHGATWYKPEDNAAVQRQWFKDFYTALYGVKGPRPDDVMDGCFVNYPSADLIDWQHLYYKGNYERLRQVKKEWDPLNVFHHRQSVELPDQ